MSARLLALLVATSAALALGCDAASGDRATSSSGAGAGAGAGGSATASSTSSSMEHPGHTQPDAVFLPKPSGACPTLVTGKATFAPEGIAARDAQIHVSADADTKDGPLVFYWHGAGGSPTEATYVIDKPVMDAILAMGGMVAAPYHDPESTTLPWFLDLDDARDDDLRVADEILGCMIEQKGVDTRRIHSIGFSAGALHTVQFAARRSGYLASVVVYSGGQLFEPPIQDPANYFAAMLFHGGPEDAVIVNFEVEQEKYHQWMTDHERFSFLCNHGMKHNVPNDGPPAAWQFLQDHPFGVKPEPYRDALPAGFPSYCAL